MGEQQQARGSEVSTSQTMDANKDKNLGKQSVENGLHSHRKILHVDALF